MQRTLWKLVPRNVAFVTVLPLGPAHRPPPHWRPSNKRQRRKKSIKKTKQEMAQDIGPANVNVRAVSVKCDNPVHRVAMANRVALAGSLKSSASISKTHKQTKLGLFTCSFASLICSYGHAPRPYLGLLMHILVKFYDTFKCPFLAWFSADFSLSLSCFFGQSPIY